MKTLLLFFTFYFMVELLQAQFDIMNKVEKESVKRANKKIDKTIDKGFDETEKGIDDAVNGEDKNEAKSDEKDKSVPAQEKGQEPGTLVSYGKYDFVPGDKIIFDDDFASETMGEFPSKWKLHKGAAENIKMEELPCLAFTQVSSQVSPLMKTENFLPKIFTLEFDVYFHKEGNEAYKVVFGSGAEIEIRAQKVTFEQFNGVINLKEIKGWHHIAIAVNDKKMKVYFNEARVLNIPEISQTLQRTTFSALSHGAAKGKPSAIKSVRIAEGGMDLYKRIMTDGKYVTRGILFDVNKATLKPQSMGTINEMVNMMKQHEELVFSIEGHTDSDGEEKFNQKLSEERAVAVKKQMISMGIEDSKLTTAGFGESKPVDNNDAPEGKANNRRVEFIKKP